MLRRSARCLAVAIVPAVLALAPATASAVTTVQIDPRNNPQYVSVDSDGGSSHVELSYDTASGLLLFSEPRITSVGQGCTDRGDTVACSPPPPNGLPFPGTVVFGFRGGDNTAHVASSFPASFHVGFRAGSGADSFIGGPEPDFVDPGPGPDFVSGGGGVDTVNYANRVTPVNVALDGQATSGNELDGPPSARDSLGADIENIVGGNASDRLVGNALPNTITGFKGHDVLIGLGGPDRLEGRGLDVGFAVGTAEADRVYGGKGRDVLLGGAAGDQLFGGPGIDRIDAKDKQHEKTINCGRGNDRRERATRDGGDPHPISC
ncbi:MAG TPA: hypothetical protein VH329_01575 [Solirubrobacterales bacterium]